MESDGGSLMNQKGLMILLIAFLVNVVFGACSKAPEEKSKKSGVRVGPVKINFHPANLEGKTVLLRWNGKHNGDHFLNRLGELLTQKITGVKVIKMWEVDSKTASISKTMGESEKTAEKIAEQKPNLVIASQAD
jgi:hypothetical protein